MKFPHLNQKLKRFERTIRLDGGLNTSTAPMVLADESLSESSNMIFENNLLKTRKGFYSDEKMIIKKIDSGAEYSVNPFKFLKQPFFVNGNEGKIGYMLTGDGMSYQKINVFFFYNDNSHISLGEIYFNRIDEGVFYLPNKFVFFSGASTLGCGIYMFAETINFESREYERGYYMYELDSSYTNWIRLSESDCYVPTVYYNGRGNLFYESAVADNDAYKKPLELESQNMLTGYFYSYFSTDGASDRFQLPISKLEDVPVVCTLSFKNGITYRWLVRSGENEAEIDFLTTKVKVRVDRENGIISFLQSGNPYPVPVLFTDNTNNLCVLAYKKIPNGIESVVSSDLAVNHQSNIILAGNSVNANEVYVASSKNPLYFSKDAKTRLGTSGEKTISLNILGDSLIALKSNQAYSIKITDGSLIASTELISGIEKSFYKAQGVSNSLINGSIACVYPETVCTLGEYLIWKGKYKIYAMTKSGKHYTVSYPISAAAEENTNFLNIPFGFAYGDFYAIVINRRIYLADIKNVNFNTENQNIRWYMWELPDGAEFTTATDFEGKPILAFKNIRGNISYSVVLAGASDVVMHVQDGEIEKQELLVGGYFKTAFFGVDAIKIEAVTLNVGALGELDIIVDSHYNTLSFKKAINLNEDEAKKGLLKKITVYPSLKADCASIKISGDNLFYLKDLKFSYR